MDIKRTFACAIIAMPLLVACNNDDKIGDDDKPAAAITLQDLAGDWNITLVTPYEISSESYFINPDGSYQYSYIYSPYEKEEDEYKPFYEYRDEGKYGPFPSSLTETTTICSSCTEVTFGTQWKSTSSISLSSTLTVRKANVGHRVCAVFPNTWASHTLITWPASTTWLS